MEADQKNCPTGKKKEFGESRNIRKKLAELPSPMGAQGKESGRKMGYRERVLESKETM